MDGGVREAVSIILIGDAEKQFSRRALKTNVVHSEGMEQCTGNLALRIAGKADSIASGAKEIG